MFLVSSWRDQSRGCELDREGVDELRQTVVTSSCWLAGTQTCSDLLWPGETVPPHHRSAPGQHHLLAESDSCSLHWRNHQITAQLPGSATPDQSREHSVSGAQASAGSAESEAARLEECSVSAPSLHSGLHSPPAPETLPGSPELSVLSVVWQVWSLCVHWSWWSAGEDVGHLHWQTLLHIQRSQLRDQWHGGEWW